MLENLKLNMLTSSEKEIENIRRQESSRKPGNRPGLMRGKILYFLAISIAIALLSPPAYGLLRLNTTFLYDLQGPTKDSKLLRQNDLFCDIKNNEVYVADTGNRCIRVFSKEGMQIFQFGQNGSLTSPLDVAVNSLGDIYVLQSVSGRKVLEVFDFRGKHLKRIDLKGETEDEHLNAEDLALDSQDNIYLVDSRNGCIHALDSEGGYRFKILPEMSEKEREEVVFGKLMIDKEDVLYLPASTIGTVYVHGADGQHIRNFGIKGGGPGKLAFPVDVAVDKHGHFLVLDKLRHCLSVYDREGRYLTEVGGMGTRPGWFFYPSCLEIDRYGRIYVSQRLGNKVQVLKIKEEIE